MKLLALDLDGTLLQRDGTVAPADRAAIAELQRRGVRVTICTGRLRSGSLGAAEQCGIDGLIACMEGSHLVHVDSGETVAHHPMTDTARLQEALGELAAFVFDKDGIHHAHRGAPFAGYVSTWSPNLRVVEQRDAWATEPLAAVAIGHPEVVARALAAAQDPSLFTVSFAVSQHPGAHAILVRKAGLSKGTALAELCAAAGCTVNDAVVVGDWVNDVPMFQVAGRSFAMPGAPPHVRAHATDSLESGGIAEAIARAFDL